VQSPNKTMSGANQLQVERVSAKNSDRMGFRSQSVDVTKRVISIVL
jgi:hypothetical protein